MVVTKKKLEKIFQTNVNTSSFSITRVVYADQTVRLGTNTQLQLS
jgi:hypothetical protein